MLQADFDPEGIGSDDATSRIARSSSTAQSSVPQSGQASTSWDKNYDYFPTIRSYLDNALKRQEDAKAATTMTTSFGKTTRFFDIDEDPEEKHARMHVLMRRQCYECGGGISPDETFDSDTYAPAGTCTENREFCSMFCTIDYLVNQCDVPVRYIFDRHNARGAEYEASLAVDFPHTMQLVRSPMSTQTHQSTHQSAVSSYPAAKTAVHARSPVVTMAGPPAKAVVTPTSPPKAKPEPSSSPMTIRARVEYEMDKNGDLILLNQAEVLPDPPLPAAKAKLKKVSPCQRVK